MEERKIVSISGRHVGDIAFYLAKILGADDSAVLICDLSEQHEIFESFALAPGEKTAYLRNLTVIKDTAYNEKAFEAFAAIVVYQGIKADKTWWDASDVQFVITNYDRYDLTDLAHGISGMNFEKTRLVFKQRFTKKIKDVDVITMLGMDPEKAKDLLEIPFDETSEAMKIAWEYNGNQRVADIPKTDQEFLLELYEVLDPEIDSKAKKKLISMAH